MAGITVGYKMVGSTFLAKTSAGLSRSSKGVNLVCKSMRRLMVVCPLKQIFEIFYFKVNLANHWLNVIGRTASFRNMFKFGGLAFLVGFLGQNVCFLVKIGFSQFGRVWGCGLGR